MKETLRAGASSKMERHHRYWFTGTAVARRALLFAGACALALVICVPSQADIIYNDFGPSGQTTGANGGWAEGNCPFCGTPGYYIQGFSFTPSQNYTLTSLNIALEFYDGSNSGTVSLLDSSGGLPGSVLENWTVGNLPSYRTTTSGLSLLSNNNLVLNGGDTYWVTVTGGTSSLLVWVATDEAINSTLAYSLNGSGFATLNDVIPGAFEVQGTAVPEPSSFLLLGSGLLGLAALGRKLVPKYIQA